MGSKYNATRWNNLILYFSFVLRVFNVATFVRVLADFCVCRRLSQLSWQRVKRNSWSTGGHWQRALAEVKSICETSPHKRRWSAVSEWTRCLIRAPSRATLFLSQLLWKSTQQLKSAGNETLSHLRGTDRRCKTGAPRRSQASFPKKIDLPLNEHIIQRWNHRNARTGRSRVESKLA